MSAIRRQTASITNVLFGLFCGFVIMMLVPRFLGFVHIEELDISVSNFTSLLNKCNSKHKALSVSFEEAKNKVEEAQQKLSECNTISNKVKSEIAAVNVQNKESNANLDAIIDQLRMAEVKVEDYRAQLEVKDQERNEESDKVINLTKELKDVKGQLTNSDNEVDYLKVKLDDAGTRMSRAKNSGDDWV